MDNPKYDKYPPGQRELFNLFDRASERQWTSDEANRALDILDHYVVLRGLRKVVNFYVDRASRE